MYVLRISSLYLWMISAASGGMSGSLTADGDLMSSLFLRSFSYLFPSDLRLKRCGITIINVLSFCSVFPSIGTAYGLEISFAKESMEHESAVFGVV